MLRYRSGLTDTAIEYFAQLDIRLYLNINCFRKFCYRGDFHLNIRQSNTDGLCLYIVYYNGYSKVNGAKAIYENERETQIGNLLEIIGD